MLHTFFAMADGACLAFFEEPDVAFDFKPQRDFDLHVALEVSRATLHEMLDKGKAAGMETRGVSDHGSIESIYFRDPNGYVVELTARKEGIGAGASADHDRARAVLEAWQSDKHLG